MRKYLMYIFLIYRYQEGEYGQEIFSIDNGSVILLHKISLTYICDLNKEDYFGEIGFFSELPR